MSESERHVSDLVGTISFWLPPLAGGVVDYAILVQRGLKPRRPWRTVLCNFVIHICAAAFFGWLSTLLAVFFGHTTYEAVGIAGGLGGFLGVRLADLLVFVANRRAGALAATD